MSQEWNLHYARWIIEDGEPERSVQDEFDSFSLEFEVINKMERGSERRTYALAASDYRYRTSAEIVFLSGKAAVLDFGLKAIGHRDQLPVECAKGEYVTGEIVLSFPLCNENVLEEAAIVSTKMACQRDTSGHDPVCASPRESSIYDPR
jgi:hypothetical protein